MQSHVTRDPARARHSALMARTAASTLTPIVARIMAGEEGLSQLMQWYGEFKPEGDRVVLF